MYLDNLIADIDTTHKHLGNLIAICMIAVKAHKFILLVSPSGCGKSTAMDYVCKQTPDSWSPLSLSIASLGNKVDKLTSFRSVINVDDIAVIQTPYARRATITTLSALCYSHRVEPSMVGFDFAIEDFYGSALVGIQPRILRDLILEPEWDASIRDKAIRYYHLYRPLEPFIGLPLVQLDYGSEFESVEFTPDLESSEWKELYQIGLYQWSKARAKEHLIDMLKAVAALDNRAHVESQDYGFLIDLLIPMGIEPIAISKDDLEADDIFNNNLVALLAEYYTYGGEFSLAQVAQDFKIRLTMAYRIMNNQTGNWQQISKSPTIYRPSKNLAVELKDFGLNIKNELELENES